MYYFRGVSEHFRTSKTEVFAKTVNGFQSLAVFAKTSVSGIWQSSQCASLIFR